MTSEKLVDLSVEVLFDSKCKISGILKNLPHYFYSKLALFLPLWIINHGLTREGILSKQGHICTISLEQSFTVVFLKY